jgi:hypothetical protein
MRQRTISDFFWRDPDISDLSQEDKATLLYFLTSPSSNIIGCYQVVWIIAAAEMGWTKDQLLVVVKRLKAQELIEFNEAGWVWVKIWWKHNSPGVALNPNSKLISHAKKQCAVIPFEWLTDFGKSLETVGVNTLAMGYPYPTHTASNPASDAPSHALLDAAPDAPSDTSQTHQQKSLDAPSHPPMDGPPDGSGGNGYLVSGNTTTTSSSYPEVNPVVVPDLIFPTNTRQVERDAIQAALVSSGVNESYWQAILDELTGARLHRTIDNPVGYLRGMAERALSGTFIQERGIVIALQRAARASQAKHDDELDRVRKEKQLSTVEALKNLPARTRDFLSKQMTEGHAK